jgi:putative ABC transport system permease protein
MRATSELAWANITHNKARTFAGVSGVAFAILLLFMQLGFYDTSFRSATMIFDQLDFDVALRSPQYTHLRAAGTLPRRRLAQAEAVRGVAQAMPLYVGNGVYQEPQSRLHREVIVFAVDPRTQPFALPELVRHADVLLDDEAAIMDATTRPDYEPVRLGAIAAVEDQRLRIGATYRYGTGVIGDASIFVSDRTFRRLFSGYPLADISLGLVKLQPGADPHAVVAALSTALPPDVEVLSRRDLEASEQHLWVRVRPVGIMFTSGVVLALAVAAVILYQILSSEIANRVREYATLKAIGHEYAFIRETVVRQAILYVALASAPALGFAYLLYFGLARATHIPMVMTLARIVAVAVLTLGISIVSAVVAVRRVKRADPADLFA